MVFGRLRRAVDGIPPREPGANGRPPRHGTPLKLAGPATWPEAAVTARADTARYGAARAEAWPRVHQKLFRRAGWEQHEGNSPPSRAPSSASPWSTCPGSATRTRSAGLTSPAESSVYRRSHSAIKPSRT